VAVHKRRPQLGGLSSADRGRGLFRCGRPHFLAQNIGFFEIYGVSARTRGVEPGGGVNFSRICTDVFYGRPLRERSNIKWRFRGGWLKLSEYWHMEEGDLATSSYNFYSGCKSLSHSFSCFIFGIFEGRGWLKTSYRGRRLAENVRIPSHGGRGSKIAQKTVIWYLNVSLYYTTYPS